MKAVRRMRTGRRDEGAVAILTAILIVVLIGFAAMAVDVGYLFQTRNELQNAADSAALAGAQMLNGETDGISAAINQLQTFAEKHYADNKQLLLSLNHVKYEFGHWYFKDNDDNLCEAPCFYVLDHNVDDNYPLINAVRVTGFRSTANAANSPVKHFFSQLLGRSQSNVDAVAVAVGGGPAITKCPFPMVVPDCEVDPSLADPDGACLYCMRFGSSVDDTAGWSGLQENGGCGAVAPDPDKPNYDPENPPGGADIWSAITAACGAPPYAPDSLPDEECQSCELDLSIGTSIQTCEGVNLTDSGFCDTIRRILKRKGEGTATAFNVTIPVLHSGMTTDECSNFGWGGKNDVVGYAHLTIFGVRCSKATGSEIVVDPSFSGDICEQPPSGDIVMGKLDCTSISPKPSGGGFYGIEAPHVRLVQ